MPTNNAYLPEIVNLTGGLDFVTPKPSVAPGALTDCFNYEVADALGYKRVDGIERFDGRPSISNCYGLLYSAVASAAINAGECLRISGDTKSDSFAFVVKCTTTLGVSTIHFLVFNTEKFLRCYVSNLAVQITSSSMTYTLSNIKFLWHADSDTTISTMLAGMQTEYTTYAEPLITAVASQSQGDTNYFNPAIGLQWFNEQLYAVVDFDSIILTAVNHVIVPGDILSISGGLFPVRDVQLISGTYAGSTAVLKVNFSYTLIGSFNVASERVTIPLSTSVDLIRGSSTITAVATTGTTATVVNTRMAGIFRSVGSQNLDQYTPSQPYTSMGWQEVDLGYLTNYTSLGANAGIAITKAGRDSSPVASTLTSLASIYPATATDPTTGGSINSNTAGITSGDTKWHNDSNSPNFPVNIQSVDTHYFGCYSPMPSGHSQADTLPLGLSGFNFTGLPTDALISGLEVVVIARNTTGGTTQKFGFQLPTISGSVEKQTAVLYPITGATTSTFVVAAVAATQSVAVNSTQGLSVGSTVYITDSTHTILGTITNIVSLTLTVTTTQIVAGAAGNTMASAATVKHRDTLGGSNDLWNAPSITVRDLTDSNFRVDIYNRGQDAGHAGDIRIDAIYLNVWYQPSASVYYFWNGVDDVSGVVTTYNIDSGDFATNTASGNIQIATVTAVGSASRQTIESGNQIRNLPAGAGVCFGTISNTASYAGLPSLAQLQDNDSRYEFIVANFYGNKDWSAIYGVSGAGRSFTYDSFYFRYIFTGLSSSLDTPRHVAFHNFHLCLGYETGAMLTSATGLPEDFMGIDGAGEFDTGDAITGLLRMNGTTLGMFCKNSIQALNGTDNSNFSQSILNPYEGAIEYTVIDCGKPVYASYKGISTFDQTNAYGSFLGNRLSANITPWLLPRLTDQAIPVELELFSGGYAQPSTQGVLFALPVRNKNQYRLYFKDGYSLTLTFMGANATPVFTLQQLVYTKDEAEFALIPFAHSSAVDDDGRDRNHLSFYDPISVANNSSDDYKYVYELDRGWGFGSNPIQAYFTTSNNFFDNPLEISNIRKIRLHGLSKGACTLSVSVSSNYEVKDFEYGQGYTVRGVGPPPIPYARSNAEPQDISLPKNGFVNSPYTFTYDNQAETNIANVGKRGRSFSLQFVTDPSTIEPPHAAQALMMQITENKADV